MSVKKSLIILGVLAILLFFGIYYFKNKNKESIYTTAKIERGTITQTVSETGTVKASSEIDLSFLNQGRLQKKNIKIGDKVKTGDILAELDYTALIIKKYESQANYDAALQKLNKLKAGATYSEIAVQQAMVDQARIAFNAATNEYAKIVDTVNENISQAEKNLSDLQLSSAADITAYEQAVNSAETTLSNTKTTYQTSINNYKDTALVTVEAKNAIANTALDTIDRTINDEDADDLIGVKSPQTLSSTKSAYTSAKNLGAIAASALSNAKTTPSEDSVKKALDSSLSYLNETFSALQFCFNALENSVTSSSFTQTELDTFKTNISTQKTNVSTAISSVQGAKQSLNDAILAYTTNVNSATESLTTAKASLNDALKNAQNALASAKATGDQQKTTAESAVNRAKEAWNLAQTQLENLLSPANKFDIGLAEAQARQAQAALDQTNRDIDNSIIKAPIDGIVTKVDFEIGEQIPAGKAVVSILGENDFEIEVLISEADIAKMSVEDKAEITLDAFGDDVKFYGKVVFIEPAETIIQDVIYYKVTVSFDPARQSPKSGMTANVVITTAEKKDTLIIPSRAIIDKNGDGKVTRVLIDNKIDERSISLGLSGDDGKTEVLTGVEEGEDVVTYVKETK